MKKIAFSVLFIFISSFLNSTHCQAQSLKDLFNKENIEKVINAATGNNNINMQGTWIFTGSAIEFETDDLLKKAGGAVATETIEKKLDEQLSKIGISEGKLSFTFNADSTFYASVKGKKLNGTYSYNSSTQMTNLKFIKLININTKINCTSSTMDLLFKADMLLKLITNLTSDSKSSTFNAIGSLAKGYDGMMIGFSLKKE